MRKIIAVLLGVAILTLFCLTSVQPLSASGTEDVWTQKAPMHEARSSLGVAAVNGKIYAIGGSVRHPFELFVDTNEEYDPATDTWTTKASMPAPRGYFAMAAYQNKIYCMGGAVGMKAAEEIPGFVSYDTCRVNEIYDTVTDTWATGAFMPIDGMGLQAHVINDTIFIVYGSYMYAYDPSNDSWTNRTRGPIPYPATSPVSVVVSNKIIVTGEYPTGLGINWTTGVDMSREQKLYIYDPLTDQWTEGKSAPMIVGEGAAAATVGTKAPQRVYDLGLAVFKYPPPSVNQVYNPITNTWTQATATPSNRSDFGIAVVNDILYVIGGYLHPSRTTQTLTNMNEQYTPIGYNPLPKIKVSSPSSQTYNVSSFPLIFTADEPINWTGYNLDDEENVTIEGNTTLTGLSNGLHNITLYVNDTFGNMGTSETIIFTVEVPFPTVLVVAASGVTAAVVIACGLILYSRKRKHEV